MKSKQIKIVVLLVIILIVLSAIGIYVFQSIKSNNIAVEKRAKELLDEYIIFSYYENSNFGPMPDLLIQLGLETVESINLLTSGENLSSDYIKSNTKYEDFKNKLLEYVTEEYFLENYSHYKNLDNYVVFGNLAAGIPGISLENITLISKDNSSYTFNAVFKDLEMYEHYLNPAPGETITENDYLFNSEITFKYENDKLVISNWQ